MNGHALDRLMRGLAEGQQGVVGREQLRQRGVCRQVIGARLRSPDWEPVTARVLRLVGMPETDGQRAMAAVLDAGGRLGALPPISGCSVGAPGLRHG